MGNVQTQYSNLVQTVENNIAQSAVNNVDKQCTSIDNGSSVIIDVGDIVGDINLVQLCTITGTDVIDNVIDTQVQSMLEALQKQKQSTNTFYFQLPVNVNLETTDIRQEIKNNIVQTALNSCNQTIENVRNGSSYVLRAGSLKGNVNFVQKGDIASDCFITNVSKIVSFNNLKASQSQNQDITVGFGNYIIIIAIVIAVVVIGVILFFFFTNKPGGGQGGSGGVKVVDTRGGGSLPPGIGGTSPGGSSSSGIGGIPPELLTSLAGGL